MLSSKFVQRAAFRPLPYDGFGFDVAAPARIGLPIAAFPRTAKVRVHRRATFTIAQFIDAQASRIGPIRATIDWDTGRQTRATVRASGPNVFDVRTTVRACGGARTG